MATQITDSNPSSNNRLMALAYACTVFVSAFLLFQVQPLMGKFILPWFGGSPSVWTTCMLVFQVLLFAGYAYAHCTTHWLTPGRQILLHCALLAVAMVTLPIAPDASWKPSSGDAPAGRIMLLMAVCVGLPYFILSATGPLLQSWFSRTHVGQSPYRLYSLSNVGSLLALLSYPFVFEPAFSVGTQSTIWSVTFVLFAGLCAFSGTRMWWHCRSAQGASSNSVEATEASSERVGNLLRPSWNLLGLWGLLAMTPSILLLASTNQVCMDVAVIPFLWILPLALYLVTFILCFDSERWYSRQPYTIATVIFQFAAIYIGNLGANVPIVVQVSIYFGAMFCACMVCHGELARLKPHPRFLTLYFLTISAGGAAGGLFAGLIAPRIFVFFYELQIGMVCLGLAYLCLRVREDRIPLPIPGWSRGPCVALMLLVVIAGISLLGGYQQESLQVTRNFYGVLKVHEVHREEASTEPMMELAHGRIAHGSQFISVDKQRIPTSYYAAPTGIGQLMNARAVGQQQRIGVVGLGVGTLAAYGRAGDNFRMYEINPDVITIAQNTFSYLRDCAADITIATGDARLSLEFEQPQDFDVLVLDAFSGDAIPIHLLTREAMEVYLKHLSPDGVLACHISNLHFDLKPVMAGLAGEFGLSFEFISSQPDRETAALASLWAMLARQPEQLTRLVAPPKDASAMSLGKTSLGKTSPGKTSPGKTSPGKTPPGKLIRKPITWTDNRSNLLQVIW